MGTNTITTELIRPITAYGHPVLRKNCSALSLPENDTEIVTDSLWETLDATGGIGLAAPQINLSLNAFVVNSELLYREAGESMRKALFAGDHGIHETFINAHIMAWSDENRMEDEACLSIPGIQEPVVRPLEIIVEYQDRSLAFHRKQFAGYTARVIQHEYDHIRGILFIDHLTPLKKKLISRQLKQIKNREVQTSYSMRFS